MKNVKRGFAPQRWMWYVLGLLASLLIIFVWKDGLSGIKLGMDLAGGVRLTYLIDYSKYESQYDNMDELAGAKKNARDIITTQIDSRISDLGVANYEAYSQLIDGKEYMVIELGGIPDVDEAKNIIGKTVELEFGLENTESGTPEDIAARRTLAENLLTDVKEGSVPLEQLGTTNGSKGVSYFLLSGTKTDLPTIYQTTDLVDTLQPGQTAETLTQGVFQSFPEELAQYGYEDQAGYIITRLVDRAVQKRDTYDLAAFVAQAPDAQQSYVAQSAMTQTGSAQYISGTLIYPVGAILPNQSGLNLTIYQYSGTGDTSTLISQLDRGEVPADVTLQYEGRLAADNASLAIPGFVYTPGQEWTTVPSADGSTIVHILEAKSSTQDLYEQYEYATDEQTALDILAALANPTVYTVESLLINNIQPRITATDPTNGAILNGGHFEYAAVGTTQFGEPSVDITFNDKGKTIFCNITSANIQKPLAIFVGGELKTNAIIQDKICGGQTQITGDYTVQEAQQLVRDLNEGALPAPLMLIQEEKVSPVLGEQALTHILRAGLIGIAAIIVYMAIVYGPRWALLSLVILVAFIIFLFALLKLVGAVLGLSGLAAIILSLGMSVDATILVFERIIENHKKGQTIRDSIIDAHSQARSAVRDGNLSTGMIAILLVFMGVNIFRGFGTMMALNIFVVLVLIYPLIKILAKHFIRSTK